MRGMRPIVFVALVSCGARAAAPTQPHALEWDVSSVEVDGLWKLDVEQSLFTRANGWRQIHASSRKSPARHELATGRCDASKRCAWTDGAELCVSRPEDRTVESCWDVPADPTAREAENRKIAERLFAKNRPIYFVGNDGTCESWDFVKQAERPGGELVHVFTRDDKRTEWTYGFDYSGEGMGMSGPHRKPLDEALPGISSGCLQTYFYEKLGDDEILFSTNKPGEEARWFFSSAACEASRDKPQRVVGRR